MELDDEFEKGMSISYSSAVGKSELQDDDVLSLTSSDPAANAARTFLSGHNHPARMHLPFLPDLHTEVQRAWVEAIFCSHSLFTSKLC